jgi:hypothetical protein
MSGDVKHVRFLRGTAAQNDAFTGLEGQVTVDTTNVQLRLHDGLTPGGKVIVGKSDIDNDQTLVHTSGNQEIGGVKTFTASPEVPAAPAGDNSGKVASTSFVHGELEDNAVLKTGDQTVAGVKTFSSSPLVPSPARFDKSGKAVSALWAYGLARQGNHLDLVDLGTPDAAFWNSVEDGTFSNCPVGGYVTLNGHRYYMAHGNYWLHCGDTETTKNHMLVVPAGNLVSGKMNNTNVTTGGYVGSDFKTGANSNTGLASLKSIIKADWGSSHILTHREHFTNAVTNGYPSGGTWYDSDIDLMSEPMVYGCKIFEPIGNGSTIPNNYTIDKSQIELFRRRPDLITIRAAWWLRGVVSAADFAHVSGHGLASYHYASGSLGFRPAFGIIKS